MTRRHRGDVTNRQSVERGVSISKIFGQVIDHQIIQRQLALTNHQPEGSASERFAYRVKQTLINGLARRPIAFRNARAVSLNNDAVGLNRRICF